MEWLRDGRRSKPDWCAQFKAWEIPTAWFDSVIKLALRRHQEVYVIQLYREHQKCAPARSEEHTSELQSLMRISYAVFCLKKKKLVKIHKILYSCTILNRNDTNK